MNKHLWFRGLVISTVILLPALAVLAADEDAPKPIRALLVTGGCCHDYANQKGILKKGLEERANIVVDIIYSDDTSTHPPLTIYGNADYASGYDLVIHDECSRMLMTRKWWKLCSNRIATACRSESALRHALLPDW